MRDERAGNCARRSPTQSCAAAVERHAQRQPNMERDYLRELLSAKSFNFFTGPIFLLFIGPTFLLSHVSPPGASSNPRASPGHSTGRHRHYWSSVARLSVGPYAGRIPTPSSLHRASLASFFDSSVCRWCGSGLLSPGRIDAFTPCPFTTRVPAALPPACKINPTRISVKTTRICRV
jgi:hypothetical protein